MKSRFEVARKWLIFWCLFIGIGAVAGSTGIFGVSLMAWICIQFAIFPLNFMSTIYFFFGLAQAATGYAAFVFYRQEHFAENEGCETLVPTSEKREQCSTEQGEHGIGDAGEADSRELVVYFSRMGYTMYYAFELAQKRGAN